MKRTLLFLLALFALISESVAQSGYFHLNGRRHRYRGPIIGQGINRVTLTNRQHYNAAKEAGANLNVLYRQENAVGYVVAPATMECRYARYDMFMENKTFDTSLTIDNAQRYGIQVMAGSGFPLSSLDRNSSLMVTYAFGGRLSKYAAPPVKLEGMEQIYEINTIDILGAVTMDYKVGAEAMLDRGKGSCFTLGAGVEPRLIMSVLNIADAQNTFRLLPHVKAEFGMVVARTMLKLRFSGNPGSAITYYDKDNLILHGGSTRSAFRLAGKGAYVFSLVWMPFSSKWHEKSWY